MDTNSLMNDVADWLIFISVCWIGFLVLIMVTIVFWQLITLMLEGFKNND